MWPIPDYSLLGSLAPDTDGVVPVVKVMRSDRSQFREPQPSVSQHGDYQPISVTQTGFQKLWNMGKADSVSERLGDTDSEPSAWVLVNQALVFSPCVEGPPRSQVGVLASSTARKPKQKFFKVLATYTEGIARNLQLLTVEAQGV